MTIVLFVGCTAEFWKHSVVSMFTFSAVKFCKIYIYIFRVKYSTVLSYEGTDVMFFMCVKNSDCVILLSSRSENMHTQKEN